MGHCSTRAALIYLHSFDERQRKLADAAGERARAALGKTGIASGATVTCGMPLTMSCTSPWRARRDLGGMLASVRVGDAPGSGTWHNRRGSVFGLPGLAGPPGAAAGAAHGPVRRPAEVAPAWSQLTGVLAFGRR